MGPKNKYETFSTKNVNNNFIKNFRRCTNTLLHKCNNYESIIVFDYFSIRSS